MQSLTTSTFILGRLFLEFDGESRMIGILPSSMEELALRLIDKSGVIYSERESLVSSRGKLEFPLCDEARRCDDLRNIPLEALHRDRCSIGELLVRVGLTGWKTNPITVAEMRHLEMGIGQGRWQRGLTIIPEEGESWVAPSLR